jgi:MFS family permease
LWEGILGGAVVLGAALGAFSGGKAMRIGRRRMLMYAMALAMSGNLLSIYLNEYTLTVAKFLFGLGVGLYCPIIPKYIEETVPAHLFEPMIASYLLAQAVGTMCSYFLGALLPDNKDKAALATTNTWLYPFVIFPLACNIIGYMGFFCHV